MWADGEAYEPYIGRWSRRVADAFVRGLDVPTGARWWDVGCGTGAVTRTVLETAAPEQVVGIDPSDSYLRYARRNITDPRAAFARADAMRLPVRDGAASVAVSGLVLNFVPDPGRAVAEMLRAVRPGGTVGVYVWDHVQGGMEIIRRFWDAAVALEDDAAPLSEAVRFPLCAPEPLRGVLRDAGLTDVRVEAIPVPARFADFADYWGPFEGGQGPAPSYLASLPSTRRDRLRDYLQSTLPEAADGSITLTARAWSARGRRPVH
ncbi:class I SAM-dependent methyltransferase [Streptomyces sp. NPDC048219]|uniref:class I SAM-dependent methyltransferase n=1 Tax=Streptomyces sp. NPDC048219 TaxID=3365517 RepID=UPI003710D226